MQRGLQIHKQAVLLEYNINAIMQTANIQGQADISMMYEHPVRMISEMLHVLEKKDAIVESRQRWLLNTIQLRYRPYETYLLSQLEEGTCHMLCADLQFLHNLMQNCERKA